MRHRLLACMLLAATSAAAHAAALGDRAARPLAIDNTGHLDANLLDLFVTNHGSFGNDLATGNGGLIYPTCSGKSIVFASGLWVSARVAGERRIAVAEFEQEYVPGPMEDGAAQPDQPAFRLYRITRGDTASADYVSWRSGAARAQGAPVEEDGRPLLLGDMTLWTTYNDASDAAHTAHAGGTAPLGVQVDQLAWAYALSGHSDRALFLRFHIANAGADRLDSTYVSLWCDVDLGGSGDDLVGFDAERHMGLAYNATDNDDVYGAAPPALGVDMMRSPLGDDGAPLGVTAFVRYIGGTDPASAEESDFLTRGRDVLGALGHDPTTGTDTPIWLTGDPVDGTGWLDTLPADRRFVLSSGPFTMAPGDSQTFDVAFLVGQGSNRLDSVNELRRTDDAMQNLHDDLGYPPPSAPLPLLEMTLPAVVSRPAGRVRACVTLPRDTAARMDLVDLAGRRRATQTLPPTTAGMHDVTLPLSEDLASGMYVVCVSAAGASVARRIVVF